MGYLIPHEDKWWANVRVGDYMFVYIYIHVYIHIIFIHILNMYIYILDTLTMLLFRGAPLHVTPGYDFAAEEEAASSASWRMTGRDEKKTDLPLAPWGWGTLTGLMVT